MGNDENRYLILLNVFSVSLGLYDVLFRLLIWYIIVSHNTFIFLDKTLIYIFQGAYIYTYIFSSVEFY